MHHSRRISSRCVLDECSPGPALLGRHANQLARTATTAAIRNDEVVTNPSDTNNRDCRNRRKSRRCKTVIQALTARLAQLCTNARQLAHCYANCCSVGRSYDRQGDRNARVEWVRLQWSGIS